jgi:hypothetical protein
MPLGRCGGMKGRGAPPAAEDGRLVPGPVPVPKAWSAGLIRGDVEPGAAVPDGAACGVDALAAGTAGLWAGVGAGVGTVGAWVGAVTRAGAVSVRVGRGGVDAGANDEGDAVGDGWSTPMLGVGSLAGGNGDVMTASATNSPAAPCGAGGASPPSSEPCDPWKDGPTTDAAPSATEVAVSPPSLPCEP